MSGLELAVSALALLEAAITVSKSLHRAYKNQKDLPNFFKDVEGKLENIKNVVGIVRDEEALRTPKVSTQLDAIQRSVRELKKQLELINPARKSAFRQFFHQLFSGSEDEKNIVKILGDLEGIKVSLIISIQVVAVGLGKDQKGATYVDTTRVRRVDGVLRTKLGQDQGLKVMRLIEDRSQDGNVPLTEEDLDALGSFMESSADEATVSTERKILNNVAKFQAFQINAPIGKDVWAHIDRLVIENNQADALSTQVNYPIGMDIFYSLILSRLGPLILISFILYFPLTYYFYRG